MGRCRRPRILFDRKRESEEVDWGKGGGANVNREKCFSRERMIKRQSGKKNTFVRRVINDGPTSICKGESYRCFSCKDDWRHNMSNFIQTYNIIKFKKQK